MFISKSMVDVFYSQHYERESPLRDGQQFYIFMKLHKCETDRALCDKIFESHGEVFLRLLLSITDVNS